MNNSSISSEGTLRTTVVRTAGGEAMMCTSVQWEMREGDTNANATVDLPKLAIDVRLDPLHSTAEDWETGENVELLEYPVRLRNVTGRVLSTALLDVRGRRALNVVSVRWYIDNDDMVGACTIIFRPWPEGEPYDTETFFILQAKEGKHSQSVS